MHYLHTSRSRLLPRSSPGPPADFQDVFCATGNSSLGQCDMVPSALCLCLSEEAGARSTAWPELRASLPERRALTSHSQHTARSVCKLQNSPPKAAGPVRQRPNLLVVGSWACLSPARAPVARAARRCRPSLRQLGCSGSHRAPLQRHPGLCWRACWAPLMCMSAEPGPG